MFLFTRVARAPRPSPGVDPPLLVPVPYAVGLHTETLTYGVHSRAGALHRRTQPFQIAEAWDSDAVASDSAFKVSGFLSARPALTACPRGDWLRWPVGQGLHAWDSQRVTGLGLNLSQGSWDLLWWARGCCGGGKHTLYVVCIIYCILIVS